MNKYKIGDIVFFTSNGHNIRKATIIRASVGSCTIKFNDGQTPLGTRVRESKLFQTEQQADASINCTFP